MTIENTYISFDNQKFYREDLCLKHERDNIDKAVFMFDKDGRLLDITKDNFENHAKYLCIIGGAEQSFHDLGYLNWVGGYGLQLGHGWHMRDDYDQGWKYISDKVAVMSKAISVVDEKVDALDREKNHESPF